jgi:phosphatidylglycerophosphate synthase
VNLRSRVAVAGALACAGVVIVAILARGVLPVGGFYAVKASGTLGVVAIIAAWTAGAHHPFSRFGPANQVTLVRAALVALVAGLVGEPATASIAAAAVWVAVIVELLDGLDGWLARLSSLASAFGARFDMEVDALLIMVLAILAWRHGKAGSWVLVSGLLRYAFVAAGWLLPWVSRPLPPSRRRQAVCVVQIAGLCMAVAPIIPPATSAPLAAVSLAALGASFLVDLVWLWRTRPTSARAPAFPSSS